MEQVIILPNLHLGPLSLSIYGLLLGVGFVIIYLAVEKKYPDRIFTSDILIVGLTTLISSRALYLLHEINAVINEPLMIFAITEGGFAFHGALIGLITSVYLIARKRGIAPWQLLDNILRYLPLAQVLGRFGNYANQELYGLPTDLPFGIYISPEDRLDGYEMYSRFHPVFLYEAIMNIFLFLLLTRIIKGKKDGVTSAAYFIGYGVIRLISNRFRIDKVFIGPFETSDLYSLTLVILGVLLLTRSLRR